ncbi:hypothetical protein Tco_1222237, partial [Tanacetum coccineum]
FSHLIRDYSFHEIRMAKQVELNKQKGKGTGQGENRPVWNNVQRLNHQIKFVPKAVLTKTGRFPINAARQNLSSQAATTSTVRKINTARSIVNETRPRNNFYKSHSPIRRPFNRTTTLKENFTNNKVNTTRDKTVSSVGGNRETAVKASAGFRRLISWQCRKQRIVATSTTEAEYVVAATNCCGQVLWIQNQMTKLSTARPKLSTDSTKIESMKLEAMVEERRIFKCWFHYHITNGHQFTISNRHQELASPEQTALGKDFSNLKELASPKQMALALAIPEQTATSKEISNPFMAGSLPKTT